MHYKGFNGMCVNLFMCVSKSRKYIYLLFKLSAYKMGVSMRLLKLQVLSLFKLPFRISGENRSLNEHLRANFGLKWAVELQKPKPELK